MYIVRWVVAIGLLLFAVTVGVNLLGHVLPSPQLTLDLERNGLREVVLLDVRTGVVQRVSQVGQYTIAPLWSVDGERLYLRHYDMSGGRWFERTLRSDSVLEQSTLLPADAYAPSWSPDGAHLAYLLGRGTFANLVVVDRMGNVQTLATNDVITEPLLWSPNSRNLAYIRAQQNRPDVYVHTLGESIPRRVTRSGDVADVFWLPDGEALGYSVPAGEDGRQVYSVDPQTGATATINLPLLNTLRDAGDGRTFAMVQRRSLYRIDLWWVQLRPDGRTPDQRLIEPGFSTYAMTWSPDGGQIAYLHKDEVYIYTVQSGKSRRVTFNTTRERAVVWRP